jgi:hypothetical protein
MTDFEIHIRDDGIKESLTRPAARRAAATEKAKKATWREKKCAMVLERR